MFWLQLLALTEKNWIILKSHPFVNLLRCLIVPIAYYVFLSFAKDFLSSDNDLGLGEPAPIRSLSDALGSKPLLWIQGNASIAAAPYTGPVPFTAQDVIDVLIQDLSPDQRNQVRQVEDNIALGFACPQSFAGNSPCFGAVEFNSFQRQGGLEDGAPIVNYTLRFAPGLDFIGVSSNNGDVEKRSLPLQFSLDRAISILSTYTDPIALQQIQEWPYTWETNAEQAEKKRRSLLNGVDNLVVLAFFIVLLGVPWHVASSASEERSSGMSHLLTSAGCSQYARLLSWLTGPTLAYIPAYLIMMAPLASEVFIHTNTGIVIAVHLLPAVAMGSWSIFLASFFLRANLSAIIVTAIAIIGAIIGLLTKDISGGAQIIVGLIFPPASFVYAFIGVSRFERLALPANLIGSPPVSEGENSVNILGQLIICLVAIVLYPILAAWVERIKYYPEPAWQWIKESIKFGKQNQASEDVESSSETPALSISNLTKKYSKKQSSLAVSDLSFQLRKGGFGSLIGSNGCGKTTIFSCIAGTQNATEGEIRVDGFERSRAPPGILGLCPQKNVLYSDLTAREHVRLFERIKRRKGDKQKVQSQSSAQDGKADEKDKGSSSSSTSSSSNKQVDNESFSQSRIDDLLLKCDLDTKFQSTPPQLSGGQKRKLQLALSIVGHSSILLVDEASSGLDPAARRAIWKILLEVNKEGKSILFTSHYLDEADLLADDVIILTAPGKILAHGSPIQLKEFYGKGCLLHTRLSSNPQQNRVTTSHNVLSSIQKICPDATTQENSSQDEGSFLIPAASGSSSDREKIGKTLRMLEENKKELGISSYDFSGPTLESVFLTLNQDHESEKEERLKSQSRGEGSQKSRRGCLGLGRKRATGAGAAGASAGAVAAASEINEKDQEEAIDSNKEATLADGKPSGFLPLSYAHFLKRIFIFKRNPMPPILAVLIAILGSAVSLAFINDRDASCVRGFDEIDFAFPLDFASPAVDVSPIIYSPQGTLQANLGNSLPDSVQTQDGLGPNGQLQLVQSPNSPLAQQVPEADFNRVIRDNYLNLTGGGISLVNGQPPLMAFRADADNIFEPAIVLANLISNAELASQWAATNPVNADQPPIINPSSRFLSALTLDSGLGEVLKWAVVFGLVQAVWPAFAALFATAERVSGAKSLALTNGQRPIPLWLGHLGFEFIVVLVATIPVIVIYSAVSDNFIYIPLGALWATLWLYGLAASLQAFVVSLFAPSALSAFAILAAWNVIAFLIHFAAVLLTVSYYVGDDLTQQINTIFFVTGILSPAVAASRAGWVGLNLFSLLCNGRGGFSDAGIESINQLGGPILYCILWGLICFGILIYVDSGSRLPRSIRRIPHLLHLKRETSTSEPESQVLPAGDGVAEETDRACSPDNTDLLQVQHVSKSWGPLLAVDDVSFSIGESSLHNLLGINGGGKSTLHQIIRGEERADNGKVIIAGIDISEQRTLARSKISSVPQHDGHDSTLTCYEHLVFFSRVKGLSKNEREGSIKQALELTGITKYKDVRASDLSGGTARKLSLSIALIGNPKILLLDELSSGVDSHTKRTLWKTLIRVAEGRSTLLTTHSMEEVEALGGSLAIQSSRILAAGTIASLRSKRPAYEFQVDLISSSCYPLAKAFVTELFPSAMESDEASARFEIPLNSSSSGKFGAEGQLSVADLYQTLSGNDEKRKEAGIRSWHVSPVSLETIFLHVVRETVGLREKRKKEMEE